MANRGKTEPSNETKAEAKSDAKPEDKTDAKPEDKPDAKPEDKTDAPTAPVETEEAPRTTRKTDPGMSAVSEEGIPLSSAGIPVEPPAMPEAKRDNRHRSETVAMPQELVVGEPPIMSSPSAGSVENPTFMPGPDGVPEGSPSDPGTVPGHVPPGDSRSLRRGLEFALVYRTRSAVISRFGVLGTRGQWRVVEYPTPASASNAYAKECSRFVADGFSDYRD